MSKLTLDQLSTAIGNMFKPDINFKWIDEHHYWHMTYVSEAGKIWMKRYPYGIKLEHGGKMITELNDTIKVLGEFGLCYQLENSEYKQGNDSIT